MCARTPPLMDTSRECSDEPPLCAGDGTTLIPVLDLMNHDNRGAMSDSAYVLEEGHRVMASYSKRSTLDYNMVRA